MGNKPNIIAKDVETFKDMDDALKTLDEKIYDQIETVNIGLIGYNCILKDLFGACDVYIPRNVTQIKDFGDYIGIYADDFFFRIEGGSYNANFNFIFI